MIPRGDVKTVKSNDSVSAWLAVEIFRCFNLVFLYPPSRGPRTPRDLRVRACGKRRGESHRGRITAKVETAKKPRPSAPRKPAGGAGRGTCSSSRGRGADAEPRKGRRKRTKKTTTETDTDAHLVGLTGFLHIVFAQREKNHPWPRDAGLPTEPLARVRPHSTLAPGGPASECVHLHHCVVAW